VTGRNPAPLGIVGEQHDEWLGIASAQRFGCRAKLLDHS